MRVEQGSWSTTDSLLRAENPNIAWDSIKFDKTLIDMEPEQVMIEQRFLFHSNLPRRVSPDTSQWNERRTATTW